MAFYVYIMASQRNGTLYIGSTDCLSHRAWEHERGVREGFTKTYGVKTLVWFEIFGTRTEAFARERAMKKWNRRWKIELIERFNPGWRNLSEEI
jgi:putative endonuclease